MQTAKHAALFFWVLLLPLSLAEHALPHGGADRVFDTLGEHEVVIHSGQMHLAGTFAIPEGDPPYQCVVIAGGTLSETRDGGMESRSLFERDALKRLSDRLTAAGYATLRWDKRGHGESDTPRGAATYADQAEDLISAMIFARNQPTVLHTIVAGESAGGYLACMAARDGEFADGYIFMGALASSAPAMYRHNFGRLREWAEANENNMRWARENAPFDLMQGYVYGDMFEAARRGAAEWTFEYEGKEHTWDIRRKREELDHPPAELFRFIREQPVLAIQGELDMNVPPDDNEVIAQVLSEAGNEHATAIDIPGADHNFQMAPAGYDERIRGRFGFESIGNPYADAFYAETLAWLNRWFPPKPDLTGAKKWGGVKLIEDITDPAEAPGVDTLEGRIGGLLKAQESQAHYIEMLPGQYTAEHAHSTESIIYTVSGRWVLCRAGHRQLMKPGTLMHFAKHVPCGFEVPFGEPAYILIFKSHRAEGDWDDFTQYLKGLRERLEEERANGEPFFLRELPDDHPANRFARSVNPDWGFHSE